MQGMIWYMICIQTLKLEFQLLSLGIINEKITSVKYVQS